MKKQKLYIIILVILLLCLLCIPRNILKERFDNNINNINKYPNKVPNIFNTDIFTNKTVFLIGNNTKLSNKTQKWLNDYKYNKDTLVVRFNGYNPIIRDYAKGITNIMVYRKGGDTFHGFNKESYDKNIINMFTVDTENDSNLEKKHLDILSKINYHILFIDTFFKDSQKYYYTSGFQFLLRLIRTKVNKIYLIGYTFHDKKNVGPHNALYEYNYFHNYIKNKYKNITIML
jgi:hypothetical protein